MFMSFKLEAVIFDDGIAEDFVAGVVNLLAPGLGVGAGKLDFEVFADVDRADALVAHLFEGVGDGLALRIKDGLLGSDNNFCFHVGRTHGCWVNREPHARLFCIPESY